MVLTLISDQVQWIAGRPCLAWYTEVLRRYGATVSTRPFQGRNTGSIPVSATNLRSNQQPESNLISG
jgi:hypothetical protein